MRLRTLLKISSIIVILVTGTLLAYGDQDDMTDTGISSAIVQPAPSPPVDPAPTPDSTAQPN